MRSLRSGATHVASARRNFLAAADPDVGASTRPCVPPDPESPTNTGSIALTDAMLRSVGAPVPLERPLTVGPVMSASFALVTTPAAMVEANEPVPDPVTSPVNVIVWSPVFVPLKLDPLITPIDVTPDGVIEPSARVMDPDDVIGLLVTVTPSVPVMPTDVTVPPPDAARICATVARLLVEVLPSTMTV